jgi:hypothetical protein
MHLTKKQARLIHTIFAGYRATSSRLPAATSARPSGRPSGTGTPWPCLGVRGVPQGGPHGPRDLLIGPIPSGRRGWRPARP